MNDFSKTSPLIPATPVDPIICRILQTIDLALCSKKIPYMVVGATARDLLLHHIYGFPITRATQDLDFGILLASWQQFREVKELLLQIPGFSDDPRKIQRLHYSPLGMTDGMPVDVVPFGTIETSEGTIEWPELDGRVMNVSAFHDVFLDSISIKVQHNLIVSTPTLAGLVVLKFFAWQDRRDARDIIDILQIFQTYADAGNIDRLYENEDDELQRVNYDMELAGAFLLGKDVRQLCAPQTLIHLSNQFTTPNKERLVNELIRKANRAVDPSDYVTALFDSFLRGFQTENLSTAYTSHQNN